jgi:Uma2 family endonuclease
MQVECKGTQLVVDDFESMAPVILTPQKGPMSDEEFAAFCRKYDDYRIESSAEGEIIIMPPAFPKTGRRNLEIGAQLLISAKKDGRGVAYDSSAGFRLPNGARRSPDAFWIRKERVTALSPEQQEGYYHLCPDFVIELRSSMDRLCMIHTKMREYQDNGAELGWLIDPEEPAVWIYRAGRAPERLDHPERIEGEVPVAGFVLELTEIWA